MPNIERRANLWYAVLVIPADVRAKLGNKFKFIQSLGTPDKRRAQVEPVGDTLSGPLDRTTL